MAVNCADPCAWVASSACVACLAYWSYLGLYWPILAWLCFAWLGLALLGLALLGFAVLGLVCLPCKRLSYLFIGI